jgi:hypothetical protein
MSSSFSRWFVGPGQYVSACLFEFVNYFTISKHLFTSGTSGFLPLRKRPFRFQNARPAQAVDTNVDVHKLTSYSAANASSLSQERVAMSDDLPEMTTATELRYGPAGGLLCFGQIKGHVDNHVFLASDHAALAELG